MIPPSFSCVSNFTTNTLTCTSKGAIAAHGTIYIGLGVFVTAKPGTTLTNTVNLTPVGTPASNYTASVVSAVVWQSRGGPQ